MIRTIDISTKEAYLDWVTEWKGYWKATVVEIRYHKLCKQRARDNARYNRAYALKHPTSSEWYNRSAEHGTRRMEFHMNERERLRDIANTLLCARTLGKELSTEAKTLKAGA